MILLSEIWQFFKTPKVVRILATDHLNSKWDIDSEYLLLKISFFLYTGLIIHVVVSSLSIKVLKVRHVSFSFCLRLYGKMRISVSTVHRNAKNKVNANYCVDDNSKCFSGTKDSTNTSSLGKQAMAKHCRKYLKSCDMYVEQKYTRTGLIRTDEQTTGLV